MRAWNVVVRDYDIVHRILRGHRRHICFRKTARTAKKIHVGDTVIVHNYFGPHLKAEVRCKLKRMLRQPTDAYPVDIQPEDYPVIVIVF